MINMNSDSLRPFDVVLVGGGLQNALIALCLLDRRPMARVAIIERERRIGGNHTWSFHAGDVPDDARRLVEQLVTYHWSSYDVVFPDSRRTLVERYAAISSERLASVVEGLLHGAPGGALLTGTAVQRVEASSVTLDDGRTLQGGLVVDARGPDFAHCDRIAGYQKFVGLELELNRPHWLVRPLLMDARVAQTDGFRFFYALPLGPRRVLLEDTYFSDRPDLDVVALRREIHAYAARQGYAVANVVREETGVLPLPARVGAAPCDASPLRAGYGGGFFHPATGYSFPVALRLARHIAETLPGDVFADRWKQLVDDHRAQFRFAALLNRMLFGAFLPESRWNALQRFYRLPPDTIRRFYALETTRADRLRIVCGRPPRGISLRVAIGASA